MTPLSNSVSVATWLAFLFFFFWLRRRLHFADELPSSVLARAS